MWVRLKPEEGQIKKEKELLEKIDQIYKDKGNMLHG